MPKDSYHGSVCISLVKYGLIEERLYEGFQIMIYESVLVWGVPIWENVLVWGVPIIASVCCDVQVCVHLLSSFYTH